jgi:L-threonylcarbamoyladenylate synthase
MTQAPKAAPNLPRRGLGRLASKDSILAINKSVTPRLSPPPEARYSNRRREIGQAAVAEILKTGEAFERALALLEAGRVVAIPTETVYGLAGDATNGEAVARIFEAKGRPRFNPLIAHVSGLVMASKIAVFDTLSEKLAEAFWPGPLTLVLPLAGGTAIHPLVTAGLDTIALRMPQGFGAGLIARFGRPLAAPSANSSGRITSTTAEAVEADLGKRIPLIVDGGPTQVGLESTIVKVEAGTLRLLRPGGIAAEVIEAAAGRPLLRGATGESVEAPGMLASHYAPGAAVRIGATDVLPGEALLAFGKQRAKNSEKAVALLNLSPAGDLSEAAANLFSYLQRLDRSGAGTIAVEPVPDTGLGEAINDRLSRAAAPRGNLPDTP